MLVRKKDNNDLAVVEILGFGSKPKPLPDGETKSLAGLLPKAVLIKSDNLKLTWSVYSGGKLNGTVRIKTINNTTKAPMDIRVSLYLAINTNGFLLTQDISVDPKINEKLFKSMDNIYLLKNEKYNDLKDLSTKVRRAVNESLKDIFGVIIKNKYSVTSMENKNKLRNLTTVNEKEEKEKERTDVIVKVGNKWRILGKKIKYWPAEYDTKADAEAALRAYWANKNK